jgi:ketosteroid isomerase-like protein
MKPGVLTILFLLPISVMAQSHNNVTEDFLQSFADAFNAHDLTAIMSHMTDDCVFEASAGPDFDGEKFTGQEAVRKAFEDVFATFPDAHWGSPRHVISGNRGFSEWLFTGTKADGTRVEVTGCDLFTFRNGKIAIKNSYRKNRQPAK